MHPVPDDATWEDDIRAVEEEARAAFLAADIPALERLWTDAYIVNSPMHQVHDKRRVLELLQSGRIRHSAFDVHIERLTRHGSVVIVMGRDRVVDPPDSTVTHRRFTNVWQFDAGGWRTIARHAHAVSREPAS